MYLCKLKKKGNKDVQKNILADRISFDVNKIHIYENGQKIMSVNMDDFYVSVYVVK